MANAHQRRKRCRKELDLLLAGKPTKESKWSGAVSDLLQKYLSELATFEKVKVVTKLLDMGKERAIVANMPADTNHAFYMLTNRELVAICCAAGIGWPQYQGTTKGVLVEEVLRFLVCPEATEVKSTPPPGYEGWQGGLSAVGS